VRWKVQTHVQQYNYKSCFAFVTDFLTLIVVNFNISVCGSERHFFLLDSFISCKNTSNEPNFIKINEEVRFLHNYQKKIKKDIY